MSNEATMHLPAGTLIISTTALDGDRRTFYPMSTISIFKLCWNYTPSQCMFVSLLPNNHYQHKGGKGGEITLGNRDESF